MNGYINCGYANNGIPSNNETEWAVDAHRMNEWSQYDRCWKETSPKYSVIPFIENSRLCELIFSDRKID